LATSFANRTTTVPAIEGVIILSISKMLPTVSEVTLAAARRLYVGAYWLLVLLMLQVQSTHLLSLKIFFIQIITLANEGYLFILTAHNTVYG